MIALPRPPIHASSTRPMGWITNGKLEIALLNGGDLISRHSWYASLYIVGSKECSTDFIGIVSVRTGAYHQTKRMQEAFPRTDA